MKKLVRQSVFLDLMGKTQVYAIEAGFVLAQYKSCHSNSRINGSH